MLFIEIEKRKEKVETAPKSRLFEAIEGILFEKGGRVGVALASLVRKRGGLVVFSTAIGCKKGDVFKPVKQTSA